MSAAITWMISACLQAQWLLVAVRAGVGAQELLFHATSVSWARIAGIGLFLIFKCHFETLTMLLVNNPLVY